MRVNRKKKNFNMFCYILIIFLMISSNIFILDTFASEPRVMLTGYTIDKKQVNCGDDFKLDITLKNTYQYSVRNMKVTLVSANGEILPANGKACTSYINSMDGDSEEVICFDLRTVFGLEEKSYKLTVRLEYEDGYGSPYKVEDEIYIPIYLKQSISVTDILMSDESVKLGDDIGISGKVNNTGDAKLYNVTICFEGNNILSEESYLGNIESGKSANFDVYLRTSVAEDVMNDKMTVFYEDVLGNKHQEVRIFGVCVSKPIYEDLVIVKEETDEKINTGKLTVAIVLVVLLMAFIIYEIRKSIRKKRILEDY